MPPKERIEELVAFYNPFFCLNDSETRDFISLAVKGKQNTKSILLQTQNLIFLADNADRIKPGRDALKLLFLIICAEAIAKLYKNFEGEGLSRFYVNMFFQEICNSQDWNFLNGAIITDKPTRSSALSSTEVVDFLYKVRCSVIHEGTYWEFRFKDESKLGMPFCYLSKTGSTFVVGITYEELRNIIVGGAVKAIKMCLANE